MSVLVQDPNGYARCEPMRLTLSIDSRLFLPHLWEQVQSWFRGSNGTAWLRQPFQVMSNEEAGPSSPRWKQPAVDVLSWLIFLLLVPADHPLVLLWQTLDWAAINRIGAPCYENGRRGQRAWAPAQMVALLVLFLALPTPSECALLRTVAIVPLYRWFCGFSLFGALPDHSSLYTFRKRVGAERFEALLTRVIEQCLSRGLIDNRLVFFDMMGVPDSAHDWTSYERAVLLTSALSRYLEQAGQSTLDEALRQVLAEVAVETLGNEQLKKDPGVSRRVLRSLDLWTKKHQAAPGKTLWELALEEAVQAQLAETTDPAVLPTEPEAAKKQVKLLAKLLKERLPHTRGDRDARMGHTSPSKLCCGYWLGFLADSFKSIITAVRVIPLSGNQHEDMIPTLDVHRDRTRCYPQAVATDSAQDYDPVHRALARRKIQGHIAGRPHLAVGGGLSVKYFTFDAMGQLLCPAGTPMERLEHRRQDGRSGFRGVGCRTCPRRAACLPKGQQKRRARVLIMDPQAHRRWQRNWENTRTEAYREARAKRFASEGLFGLARRLYGADKMPYRSLAMNRIAGVMIGVVMDLAVLARER